MDPKVSIIIPVYNSEKYISRCIESILKQTYKNIEIITINDGSKDLSEEVILQLQKENEGIIRYYAQENQGISRTRNSGIKLATGKYLMFIDNDDYIDNDYVERFVNEAESKEYDVVIGGHRRTNEKNEILYERKIPNTQWGKYVSITPWARIYKRSYILENNIEFLECNIGEDLFLNLQAVTISEKIGIIDYVGYNWFYNSQSVSNTLHKNFYDVETYKLLNETHDAMKKKGILQNEKEQENIQLFYFIFFVWLFIYTKKSLGYKEFIKEYNKIFSWLEERFPNYKKIKAKPKGDILSNCIKIAVFMFLHKCHLGAISLFCYTRLG